MGLEPKLRQSLIGFAQDKLSSGELKPGYLLETDYPGIFVSVSQESCPDSPTQGLALMEEIETEKGRICVFLRIG